MDQSPTKAVLDKARGKLALLLSPLLALATLAYLALSPRAAMSLYDKMIFEPDHTGDMYPKQIAGCSVEAITIKMSDGNTIFCWYAHNPKADKTVLLSHGHSGDLSESADLVEKLLRAGASVFAYDYEGFGLSAGSADVTSACTDGVAVYDYLTKMRHVQPQKIVLFGESLGTGVTCQIAKLRPCNGIILQSPFISLMAIAREKDAWMRLYPSILFPRQRLDSLRVLATKHARLLIVHGALDDVVPVEHGIELYRRAEGPKQLIILPDGHHEDMPQVDATIYDTSLKQFLSAA